MSASEQMDARFEQHNTAFHTTRVFVRTNAHVFDFSLRMSAITLMIRAMLMQLSLCKGSYFQLSRRFLRNMLKNCDFHEHIKGGASDYSMPISPEHLSSSPKCLPVLAVRVGFLIRAVAPPCPYEPLPSAGRWDLRSALELGLLSRQDHAVGAADICIALYYSRMADQILAWAPHGHRRHFHDQVEVLPLRERVLILFFFKKTVPENIATPAKL